MNKNIHIALLFLSINNYFQTMDYYESEQKTYKNKSIDSLSKKTLKEIPETIKTELKSKKIIDQKIPEQVTQKTNTPNNISPHIPEKVSLHDIDFNPEQKKPLVTNLNYAGIDLSNNDTMTNLTEKENTQSQQTNTFDEFIEYQLENTIDTLFSSTLKNAHLNHNTLDEIIISSLQSLLFHLLGLSKNMQQLPATESFKKELQYLYENIQKYNGTNIYFDIEQMVIFLQSINTFLKESHLILLSPENINSIDAGYATAITTSNLFKEKNIILDFSFVPNEVKEIFAKAIDDGQILIQIKNSKIMIPKIYDKNGSINIIIDSWNTFMKSNLKKVPHNLYYAAFTTFLLIFQDSILATICLLNETSKEFKVTNQLQEQFINYSNKTGSLTNTNNSLSIAVSSD